jgi:hypothetical protein
MINQLVAVLAVSAVAALPPVPIQSATALRPVACATQDDLFDLLNAADRSDVKAEARLTAGTCRPLAGQHYKIVDAENGVLTLRLFPHEGDWATSRLAFTIDEMVPAD